MEKYGISITQVLEISIALGLILVSIAVLGFILKKLNKFKTDPHQELKIISSMALNRKNKLVLVKALEKEILLAVGDNNTNCILIEDNKNKFEESLNQSLREVS